MSNKLHMSVNCPVASCSRTNDAKYRPHAISVLIACPPRLETAIIDVELKWTKCEKLLQRTSRQSTFTISASSPFDYKQSALRRVCMHVRLSDITNTIYAMLTKHLLSFSTDSNLLASKFVFVFNYLNVGCGASNDVKSDGNRIAF